MKYCPNCKLNIRGQSKICPLCQTRLSGESDEVMYPEIKTVFNQYRLFFKLLILGCVVAATVSVAINLILPSHGFWSLLVVLGIACFWVSLIVAFRNRNNIPKNITNQVVIISLLSVLWDYVTGWRGWSLNYIVPIVCVVAMLSLGILARVLKFPEEDYQVCLAMDIVFGTVPVIFYLTGLSSIAIPSVICASISIISLAFIILFKGRKIKSELEKRFHI